MARLMGLVAGIALAFASAAQTLDRTLVLAPKEVATAESRYALVIGNSAYPIGPLRNPVNDARAMARTLGETGFNVVLLEDATLPAMQRAIRDFGDRLAKGGVGLFYFAGHGMQIKGRNYLIPVNADIAREYEIEFGSLDVNLVLAMMDAAKNALNIVILDACRNNPFARNFRGIQNGLAQMDAPTGTFIAFATAPGAVADDGAEEHGVYTKHILAHISRPGVPIELMFKQVRNAVIADTKGRQIPWESSSLRGEFAFRPAVAQPNIADIVAEALRKERDLQRRETEKLIAAALERQRRQFEQLGFRPVEPLALPALPASVPAAVLTASAAPTSVTASAVPRLPHEGDSWTYRLSESSRASAGKPRSYVAKVLAASDSTILEEYSIDDEITGEWAHSSGSYIAGLGKSVFAPYLPAFADFSPGMALRRVQIVDPACTGNYACSGAARLLGSEMVEVPAGSFAAYKVEIEQTWWPAYPSGNFHALLRGGRTLTVWYVPSIKRAVKFSSRATFGEMPPLDATFDLELVSYQVK